MNKISVIIPLNSLINIDKTLYSVINQNYQYFQILIITDQNSNFIENNKITVIKVQKKSSIPELLNVGLNSLNTEYICFLNPGDLFLFDALKIRYEMFLNKRDIVACYGLGIDADCNYKIIYNKNYEYFVDKSKCLPESNIKTLLCNDMDLSLSSLMIKKDILANLKFNPNLKTAYLFDFLIRLFSIYEGQICQIRDPLYVTRMIKYKNERYFINYLKESNNLISEYFKNNINSETFICECFRNLYYYLFSVLVEYYPYNFWLRFYLLVSYLNRNKQLNGKLFELWFISILFNSINVAKSNLLKQKTV